MKRALFFSVLLACVLLLFCGYQCTQFWNDVYTATSKANKPQQGVPTTQEMKDMHETWENVTRHTEGHK